MAKEPEHKPRSLWEMMGNPSETEASTEESSVEESSVEESPIDPPPAPTREDVPHEAQGKGLWAMMGGTPATEEKGIESDSDADSEVVLDVNPSVPPSEPMPDWFRPKTAAPAPTQPPPQTPKAEDEVLDEGFFDEEESDEETKSDQAADEETAPTPTPVVMRGLQSPAEAKRSKIAAKSGRSHGAMLSAAVGLFALPMTLLAARPEIWTRVPATFLGFGAMVLGLISFNEIQRSRGKQTGVGFAMAGMILGTVAMFLGPLVIAPWSKKQSQSNERLETVTHLEAVGSALQKYHDREGQFPDGSTYHVDEQSGESTALHSWMTSLLPYLEEQETYDKIDLTQPWSATGNQPAMSRQVPAFLAGGVKETQSSSGYGLSHFSGVGGQVETEEGRQANVGIFDRRSHVTLRDIVDGRSQTLVAGEIPQGYRPWGEPGNWRTIGNGLNRDSSSFGNANNSGAMFLHADGSVRFYSNQVSVDVLKRLSTRDGEDNDKLPSKYR